MTSPYRHQPPPPPRPRRPLLCWLGWHRWAGSVRVADHLDGWRTIYRPCVRCGHGKIEGFEDPNDTGHVVHPQPVSQEFIDAMAAAGARPELVARLRAEHEPIIIERRDVSVPGSALKVTEITLSESARRSLTFDFKGWEAAPPKERAS